MSETRARYGLEGSYATEDDYDHPAILRPLRASGVHAVHADVHGRMALPGALAGVEPRATGIDPDEHLEKIAACGGYVVYVTREGYAFRYANGAWVEGPGIWTLCDILCNQLWGQPAARLSEPRWVQHVEWEHTRYAILLYPRKRWQFATIEPTHGEFRIITQSEALWPVAYALTQECDALRRWPPQLEAGR